MSQEHKVIFRRIYDEVFNQGILATVDELVAEEVIEHAPGPTQGPGREGFKHFVLSFRRAFPDLRITVEDLIAEGDRAVARITIRGTHHGDFMGIAPTGRAICITETNILRFQEGKIVEHWGNGDDLGLLQQLGIIPPLDHASQAT